MNFVCLSLFTCFISYNSLARADVNIDDKKKEIIIAHNQYRSMHNAPSLEMDSELNSAAQKWADALALMDESLMHHPRAKYGENLWMVEGARLEDLMTDDLNPVRDWYVERNNYPGVYDNSTYQSYGHFTQVIWRKTWQLGVGIAQSERGNIYVVCNYNPKGNIVEEFSENVHPLLKEYAHYNTTDPFNVFPVKSGTESVKCHWLLFVVTSAMILLR